MFALETNRAHSVVFEIASKYCISDSFVDYNGYSISSKGFLPTFFSIPGQDINLDYCGIEWFALETNRDHSAVFEIVWKYCISNSFVDYYEYSISSNGFLPTVVDIMVILVKFACF